MYFAQAELCDIYCDIVVIILHIYIINMKISLAEYDWFLFKKWFGKRFCFYIIEFRGVFFYRLFFLVQPV